MSINALSLSHFFPIPSLSPFIVFMREIYSPLWLLLPFEKFDAIFNVI